MEEEDGMRGGSEGDIRSLFYWSRSALITLGISAGVWVVLGAWRIWEGLTWLDRARLVGTTEAYSDITTGVVLLVVAVATGMLWRLIYLDIYQVFSERRFQVPREKLLVYGILALPFGFVVSGSLLLIINIKLSHPDFLPSHAEAYPEAMPGFVQIPRAMLSADIPAEGIEVGTIPEDAPTELAPLGFDDVPVSAEDAQPAPEFFGEGPAEAPAHEAVPEAVAEPAPVPAIAEAYVEEVPLEEIPDEEVPEVVAEIAPGEPVPADYEEVEAYVEDAPAEAIVEAVVEEVPPGDEGEGDFEMVEEVPGEEAEAPQTIEEAHEDLLGKLLGK